MVIPLVCAEWPKLAVAAAVKKKNCLPGIQTGSNPSPRKEASTDKVEIEKNLRLKLKSEAKI